MRDNPLVSVVIPTKNSEDTIRECIESVKKQTYPNIEIIIVDNYSTDDTVKIANVPNSSVYFKGPERSAQRNFGASESHGEYILFLDSDMMIPECLIQKCVETLNEKHVKALLIPYISIGSGYWTKCRCLESLFYQTKEFSIPRFFKRSSFMSSGGFDVSLSAGEDMELYLRIINLGFETAISSVGLTHLERRTSFSDLIRKDIWAMPYVSRYFRKRKKYNIKFPSARFPLLFLGKMHMLKSHSKYFPGLFLLKLVDYLIVLYSWLVV